MFGEFAPVYDIAIEESNLKKTWYTIDGGITNMTLIELTGIINQTLWDGLPNGFVTIRFYAQDTLGNIGFKDVIIVKDIDLEPPVKLLQVEISNHLYSLEYFNLTFFICDKAGQGIDSATIQVWWNGTDVSTSVRNLGNGFYFVSLEPITVSLEEEPIVLKMVISASGYEYKDFETYIAVDPEILDKRMGNGASGIPLLIFFFAITSITGGVGIATWNIVFFRKKRGISGDI